MSACFEVKVGTRCAFLNDDDMKITTSQSVENENLYANMHTPMSGPTMGPNHMYSSYANSAFQPDHGNSVDSLTDTFGNVSLRNGSYSGQDNSSNGGLHLNGNAPYTSMNSKAGSTFMYQLPDAVFTHSGPNPTQASYRHFPQHFNWPNAQGSQFEAAPLHNYLPNSIPTSNAANNHQWLSTHNIPPPPELRRTSWSSREEASPQTPTNFGPGPGYGYQTWQSPVYSTPSPMSANNPLSHQHLWKQEDGDFVFVDYWKKMMESPSVPDPVPAIHSGPDGGRGTLDKILDNRDGTTNVYVRGLQPNTSDDMLHAYGERFGAVVSCKSIIDPTTGTCKGFGFIKYHNYIDAENCIRGFWLRGYEAKFARKSHNSRLKDLSRPDNTNLYVSNLPKLINEEGLKKMFQAVFPEDLYPHHQAGSCKILKDSFETPTICDEIVQAFNNRTIGEDHDTTMLQIRFADTEEQKQLKAFTAVKRQFKADEYNEAAYGVLGSSYSPSAASYQSPLQSRATGVNAPWINHSPAPSVTLPQARIFPLSHSHSPLLSSLGSYQHSALRSRQPSNLTNRLSATKTSTGATSLAIDVDAIQDVNQSPSLTAAAKKFSFDKIEEGSVDEDAASSPMKENVMPSKSYASNGATASPTKSRL
ncbi:uncharacterized protein KY384_007703 [Bacidia gigantensis]|uniref:uncharacterized protein n=1 Tax=Bacidia gigantensis TaxID=2732470 RepID=UPI001D0561CE|nr:uncharacterized protein KY384_007703 [Bacidia gigantensis]KAG8527551.1 hypothetical protein KY384_007703 [Bacidia gigantensis]